MLLECSVAYEAPSIYALFITKQALDNWYRCPVEFIGVRIRGPEAYFTKFTYDLRFNVEVLYYNTVQ